jgi:hypothetical protein
MAVADMGKQLRSWIVYAVLVVVGVLVGYALPQSSVSPKSETGTVTNVQGSVGDLGSHVAFLTKGVKGKVTYPMRDQVPWQAVKGGSWHQSGQPSCLVPGSAKPVKVTLGVITVDAVGSAPGGPMVVWVECYS